jgi:hypothetical protein
MIENDKGGEIAQDRLMPSDLTWLSGAASGLTRACLRGSPIGTPSAGQQRSTVWPGTTAPTFNSLARLDLAFAIRNAHAAGNRHGAVVRQHARAASGEVNSG